MKGGAYEENIETKRSYGPQTLLDYLHDQF